MCIEHCYMLSSPILKTVLHSSNIFFNFWQKLSSIIVIFPATHPHSSVVAITYHNNKWPHKTVNLLISDIVWEVHKRTWQEVSAELESYIYKVHMIHATNNQPCPHVYALSSCLPYFLLKATMLYICALTSSSRLFHHVLGLWHYIM